VATHPHFRHALAAAITAAALVTLLALTGAEAPTSPKGPDEGRRPRAGRDWPMFGGSPARNLVNLAEKGIPTTGSTQPGVEKNVKWAVALGTTAYGGPVVAGGKVFLGTNNNRPRDPSVKGDKGVLMCFRASDGEFLWQAVHDKLETGRVNDWPDMGIVSMPAVEGNRLYYVSNRCELVCADTEGMADGNQGVQDEKYRGPRDADVIWRLDMRKELNVFPHNLAIGAPLLVGDTLFVVTANGVDEGHLNIPSPEAPSFLAVDKKTGKVLWSDNSPTRALVEARKKDRDVNVRKLVNEGRLLMHGQWSNPVYAEPGGKPMVIFPGGDGWIYAFHPGSGELIWKFDCNPKKSVYVLGGEGTRNDFIATPVVWEDKLYIGVGQDPEHKKGVGHLWCIDIAREPKNADKDLSPADDNFDPRAEVNKDSGLVWHFGGTATAEDAERAWVFGRTVSTCAVHDGLCYAAEFDGVLHCLDARTGQKYWEHEMRADTWGSPYWVDGHVYLGNEAGHVLVFEHGKEKKLVGRIDLGRQCRIRGFPVAAHGVLYVATVNPGRLYAIAAP
jgi:outer membrane protein assembly factor BamB